MISNTAVTLIFPHQLFKLNPSVSSGRRVILIEEYLFFRQVNFNQQKLILHRASMKFYASYLAGLGHEVTYIESISLQNEIGALLAELGTSGITEIHFCDPVDNYLQRRLTDHTDRLKIKEVVYRTPYFVNQLADTDTLFASKKNYFHADFYLWQRKNKKILLEADGKPVGGKWSFDDENRQRFPKKEHVPALSLYQENTYTNEARRYVTANFSENYGSCHTPFAKSGGKSGPDFYAVTFDEADQALQLFLAERFEKFGIYEDALVRNESVLYHSMLSALINIGLLTPGQVIESAMTYASENAIPLNSLEGFLRQITGWREFIRIVYEKEGSFQRTRNYWGFSRKIPAAFWTGDTGIEPVDIVIKKTVASGYAHHIERLMVMGNFFLLCEFDPDEVYRWFMEMHIDAYDWVMVPNVYGMTQFADGGLMTTKPYISGSNYLMKMGDWEKGAWQTVWDGLFWRFMHVHRAFFLSNPRLGMLVHMFDKMDRSKQQAHLAAAETYLTKLDLN